MSMTARPWTGGLFILISAFLMSSFTFAESPSVKSARASTDEFNARPVSTVPAASFLSNLVDLELVDQNGTSFHYGKLIGKVALFNFIFTQCESICPMQTKVLADVMSELPMEVRRQVHFISISTDPHNDTPAAMQAFARALKADVSNWDFLTGDLQPIKSLGRRLLIFNEGQETQPKIHRTSLWLVDKQGRMLQRYRGDPPDKDRLIRELIQISRLTTKAVEF